MLFGRESVFNSFLSEQDLIEFWNERNSQFSWGFLAGQHGSYCLEPNVQTLTKFITEKSCEAVIPPEEPVQGFH